MSMWAMLGVKAKTELADLLLSKEAWLAVVGVVAAIAKWQGWDISLEVFVAIETLIVAVILALKGATDSLQKMKTQGWSWSD